MAKPQEKIKYRGATYFLADPPQEIMYRGAKYVLAAKPLLEEDQRKEIEDKLENAGYTDPRARFHLLASLTSSIDNYNVLLGKAADAADQAWKQAKGGIKQLVDARYDKFLLAMLNDPEHVLRVVNNASDELARSFALFEKSAEFKDLTEKALYMEGFTDPTIFNDVRRQRKPEIDKEYANNIKYIKKNWPVRPV